MVNNNSKEHIAHGWPDVTFDFSHSVMDAMVVGTMSSQNVALWAAKYSLPSETFLLNSMYAWVFRLYFGQGETTGRGVLGFLK